MRSPRYSPPQTRQNVAGRVLALPSDSHELFRRDLRQSLARAAAVKSIHSRYHLDDCTVRVICGDAYLARSVEARAAADAAFDARSC